MTPEFIPTIWEDVPSWATPDNWDDAFDIPWASIPGIQITLPQMELVTQGFWPHSLWDLALTAAYVASDMEYAE